MFPCSPRHSASELLNGQGTSPVDTPVQVKEASPSPASRSLVQDFSRTCCFFQPSLLMSLPLTSKLAEPWNTRQATTGLLSAGLQGKNGSRDSPLSMGSAQVWKLWESGGSWDMGWIQKLHHLKGPSSFVPDYRRREVSQLFTLQR